MDGEGVGWGEWPVQLEAAALDAREDYEDCHLSDAFIKRQHTFPNGQLHTDLGMNKGR